ncbi:MAG: pteridine reductase [Gammaproteobacteria bacterium]|nr:pteridine reductase [Gammaproteobacteria bacterium]TVQ46520.1 MAG: pteridine reductase [Gammaproteobacteria bacterium]
MSELTPPIPLDGKWALITGAAKRIGAVVADTLHAAGANIAIHYRGSAAEAEKLQAKLEARRADSTLLLQADILDTAALPGMVEQLIKHAGRLDVLINNASSFYPTPLGTVTEAQWDDLMGSNLKAPLFLSQAALPHLKAARGSIVNMVDIHAQRPLRDHTVYGPAKAGLVMLTLTLAKDLGPDVRVNGVAPGAILWPDDGMSDKLKAGILRRVPLKRVGEPSDIARTILFLTRDAPYITGQVIAVDGGRSLNW